MAERQAKLFSSMLNRALDNLDMPTDVREREALMAKLLGITREKARVMLNGYSMPNDDIYTRMVDEFGIEPHFLAEEDDSERWHESG